MTEQEIKEIENHFRNTPFTSRELKEFTGKKNVSNLIDCLTLKIKQDNYWSELSDDGKLTDNTTDITKAVFDKVFSDYYTAKDAAQDRITITIADTNAHNAIEDKFDEKLKKAQSTPTKQAFLNRQSQTHGRSEYDTLYTADYNALYRQAQKRQYRLVKRRRVPRRRIFAHKHGRHKERQDKQL